MSKVFDTPIPYELIVELSEVFPFEVPGLNWDINRVQREAGRQDVIKYLIYQYDLQNNED